MNSEHASDFGSFAADHVGSVGLRSLLSQLNDCLHDYNLHQKREVRNKVRVLLEQLQCRLTQCAVDLEGDGPLYDAIQRNPWLTTRIQQIRQQQQELSDRLEALLEVARSEGDWSVCSPQIHWKLDHFVECCHEFDTAAQSVLHEAFPGPDWLHELNRDAPFP